MNHDYLTVTALNQYIHKKFENDPYLGKVYLTGELSNWRKRPGHQYFVIKDDHSVISAVMWKGAFAKIKFEPKEGMKVLITGRVTSFAKSGQYQIYVEAMQPDGVGNLYLAYEQLKKKLYDEGLFDEQHKQVIPQYPKKIAVITSQSGAVIRDIIDAVRKRDPHIQVVLYPAAVQGEGAAQEIVNQIEKVNQNGTFDTLIVGRGGGSIEDLWPFNEEIVAQAIYNSKIPIISSVGHQTDNTIADFVADQRASTPTQAGVIASPELTDVIYNIRNLQNSLENSMRNLIKIERQKLKHLQQNYVFKDPRRIYEAYSQQVDLLSDKLLNTFREKIQHDKSDLLLNISKLMGESPYNLIEQQQNQLNYLTTNLKQNINALYLAKQNQLRNKIDALDHLSPLKIMARGYSMIEDSEHHLIRTVADVKLGEKITVSLSDGSFEADVSKIKQESDK